MDQRHVATCANRCWQQLPLHARHVGDDDDDDDDCVAPAMGNETDMDVDVECERAARSVRGSKTVGGGGGVGGGAGRCMVEVISYIKRNVNHELD